MIVAGAGPSGCLAAYLLAKNGISTAVVEKKNLPRYKTCGGGLVNRARKAIPFDISDVVEREFYKVKLALPDNGLCFEVLREIPIISMVMRDTFDHHLAKKAQKAGADFYTNESITKLHHNRQAVLKTDKRSIECRFVIAADGALGKTARLAGFNDNRYLIPALEYEVKASKEVFDKLNQLRFDVGEAPLGYGWIFPKRKHLSIGILSTQRGKLNLQSLLRSYLQKHGLNGETEIKKHGFQIPLSPNRQYFKNNVLLTGDAAGFPDPMVAEGLSNAIISGKLAAQAIIEGKFDSQRVEKGYQRALDKKILSVLSSARFHAALFYRANALRNYMFRKKGQYLCETITDIFTGEKDYPRTFKENARPIIKALFK